MKNKILIRPIISEKSMTAAAKNRFTFEVDIEANKNVIAAEVAKIFKVTPLAVQTITMPGKVKLNRRNRKQICEQKWKKAIITLPKGQKIALFDVTEVTEGGPTPEVKKETKKGAKKDA